MPDSLIHSGRIVMVRGDDDVVLFLRSTAATGDALDAIMRDVARRYRGREVECYTVDPVSGDWLHESSTCIFTPLAKGARRVC